MIAKCKNEIAGVAAFYPLNQAETCYEITTNTGAYLTDIDTYNAVRQRTSKRGVANVQPAWIEPMLWCLDNLEWTHEIDNDANIVQKRSTSCTFVELTCAIDILTGGRCGPKDGSYRDKIDRSKKAGTPAQFNLNSRQK